MIAARRLDGAFQRLRTAIGEEHRVGKGVIHQPLRQLLALGAAIQVRHMHQGRGLFLNGLHEMRMTMAQQIDGNTAGEIQITLTTFADQVRSEEHTSELQSLMRNSYAVFCLKKKKN